MSLMCFIVEVTLANKLQFTGSHGCEDTPVTGDMYIPIYNSSVKRGTHWAPLPSACAFAN